MPRVPGCEAVYEVADQWRERCLIQDKSLLWPDLEEPTWSVENLERARDVVLALRIAKSATGGDYETSFSDQSTAVRRCVGDSFAVFYLFPGDLKVNHKIAMVQYAASWSQQPYAIDLIERAITESIGAKEGTLFKQGFQLMRHSSLALIFETGRRIKAESVTVLDRSAIEATIKDASSEIPGSSSGRNMLLHLLFPEEFEPIFNDRLKTSIASAPDFSRFTSADDADERLFAIRESLEEQLDKTAFSFFDEPVRKLWRPDEDVPFDANRSSSEVEPLVPEQVDPAIEELAEKINLMPLHIRKIGDLLVAKKQFIFEGPPGSGKTFIADKFARYFTGNPLDGDHDDRIELVQFHQSYGYEDFVQGIRPETSGGQLTYHVKPGIFLEMCERAESRPDEKFVLIIDEINRGNLSRIFGELLMALEYRDKPVRLANRWVDSQGTSRSNLQIPENLYLIGTMNSTDRSLAMIDYALRRRFYFYPLRPVVGDTAPVLERWLAQSDIPPAEQHQLLTYFIDINRKISDALTDDYQIGHSYFMREQITTDTELRQVWEFALKPLLHEYFHSVRGGSDRVEEFAPWTLRASVKISDLDPRGDGLSPDEV